MPLSVTKIRELEILALQLRTDPDTLLNALISLGFEESKKGKVENIQKLTPEQKVKAIEEEALNKGWTYEQLWCKPNYKRYDLMGVICFVDDKTIVGEVTEKHISLIHEKPAGGPVINILEKETTVPKFIYEIYKRLEKREN